MLNQDDIIQLRSEYDSRIELFNQLIKTVKFTISQEIQNQQIKIHAYDSRIKPFDSFLKKIREKRVKEPFQEIMDLVGLRIVCLFRSDVKYIEAIVEKNFEIIEKDDKCFCYISLHYKAKLKDGQSDYKDLKDIPFEIQIRTIAQDAWASISHYLDYKNEREIPVQLKRDFHALSGLLYVADTNFDILQKEVTKHYTKNNE